MKNNFQLFCFGLFSLILCHTSLFAQKTYLNNRYLLERISSSKDLATGTTGMFSSLPSAPPGIVGDSFLDQEFAETTFLLFNEDKIVSGFAVKYDIYRDEFYLLLKNVIRILPGSQVKNFSWIDSLSKVQRNYVNGKIFKDESGVGLTGFFEVLVDGPISLLKKTEVILKTADYHVALNVGNKDHKIIKKETYFSCKGDIVTKLPASKNISEVFTGMEEKIQKFIKINQLDLKKESHLIGLFDYHNTLTQ